MTKQIKNAGAASALCELCPRRCKAERSAGKTGFCGADNMMRIARAAIHQWEEPVISGTAEKTGYAGSGAVFFTGCTLRCVYCQNFEISSGQNQGVGVTPAQLAKIFSELIQQGACNINLVNPTHFALQIRKALQLKKPDVPVVYNSSGYERRQTLQELKGYVDIYLPDFKYGDSLLAKEYSAAPDYKEVTIAAISEMVKQVGPPVVENGLMKQGVLIRHLILPGRTRNSIAVLRLIKERFPGIPVSLMAQYTPCGKAADYAGLSRKITGRELQKVEDELFRLGLDGYVQERSAADTRYIPDFKQLKQAGEKQLAAGKKKIQTDP